MLNDLFGIQSRGGCFCAGPYGHYLWNFSQKQSIKVQDLTTSLVGNLALSGLKPGWTRINLHWTMTDNEFDFVISAVEFMIEHGHKFLIL